MNNKYALLSVFDKTGIVEFAKLISNLGYKIIATDGTAKILTQNNVDVLSIQDITGNPESFDGRMKTISFQIESGILFDRNNPQHVKEVKDLKIKPIDIVVCNLYPFEKTIGQKQASENDAIENIDVGGPTMIRAAAKNFKNVLAVTDPNDYQTVGESLQKKDDDEKLRKELMAKAFYHLSFYDSQIAHYFSTDLFPDEISLAGRKFQDLRYGENPHQKGTIYFTPNTNSPLKNLKQLWGRALSLVNITDINAGLESVKLFKEPAAVIIKHNSPCGVALGKNSAEALARAIESDPESAFGGVIVLNSRIESNTVKVIASFKDAKQGNFDIIACTEIDEENLEKLKTLRKSMGIYTFGEIPIESNDITNLKSIDGGFVLQTTDNNIEMGFKNWEVVTKLKPNKIQTQQMRIAWKFISRIRSNAVIVVDKEIPMTRGIGSGQTSRVRSTKIALEQAGKFVKNAILASDSFFPFDDSVRLAAKYGVGAIVQQGDSINDTFSIQAADELNIAMVFTHRRSFWH